MLCHFAHTFPDFVENFLSLSRPLQRRFREETVTDVMMGSLITCGLGCVSVDFPDEPTTGADMEWNFVNPTGQTFFRIILQAKQAYGEGQIWKRHSYKHLFHTVGAKKKLQMNLLTETARAASVPTYPLYIFYNSSHTCDLARADGVTNIRGVTLTEGYIVSMLAKKSRTSFSRSVGFLSPFFFDLTALFCPPSIRQIGPLAYVSRSTDKPFLFSQGGSRGSVGVPIPPSPESIRNRLVQLREELKITDAISEESFPEVPEVGRTIPDEVQSILSRREAGLSTQPQVGLNRWRVTFVSSNTPESDRARLKLD